MERAPLGLLLPRSRSGPPARMPASPPLLPMARDQRRCCLPLHTPQPFDLHPNFETTVFLLGEPVRGWCSGGGWRRSCRLREPARRPRSSAATRHRVGYQRSRGLAGIRAWATALHRILRVLWSGALLAVASADPTPQPACMLACLLRRPHSCSAHCMPRARGRSTSIQASTHYSAHAGPNINCTRGRAPQRATRAPNYI